MAPTLRFINCADCGRLNAHKMKCQCFIEHDDEKDIELGFRPSSSSSSSYFSSNKVFQH